MSLKFFLIVSLLSTFPLSSREDFLRDPNSDMVVFFVSGNHLTKLSDQEENLVGQILFKVSLLFQPAGFWPCLLQYGYQLPVFPVPIR